MSQLESKEQAAVTLNTGPSAPAGTFEPSVRIELSGATNGSARVSRVIVYEPNGCIEEIADRAVNGWAYATKRLQAAIADIEILSTTQEG